MQKFIDDTNAMLAIYRLALRGRGTRRALRIVNRLFRDTLGDGETISDDLARWLSDAA